MEGLGTYRVWGQGLTISDKNSNVHVCFQRQLEVILVKHFHPFACGFGCSVTINLRQPERCEFNIFQNNADHADLTPRRH